MDLPYICRLGEQHLDSILLIEGLCFADPWSREAYRYELVQNSFAHYYGCFQDECLAGFCGFWKILDEGHIVNVAVHPDFRHQGLGQVLVTHLMTACQAMGCTDMTLEARESNKAALALYYKMGFESAGIRPRYYDNHENAIIMWKKLEG